MAANSILANMTVRIAANTAQFNQGLREANKSFNNFSNSVTSSIKGLVAGFGAMQIAQFTLEVSKLAGEAQGVSAAFNRLPESVKLMNELKKATSGTVSELELMKRANQAANFGISLQALPKLLEFAAIRAQQTGQSVDYLVDSIVTGIGRKSVLILDNLGISATRLKSQFNGASLEAQEIGDVALAVGRIAEEELGKMGKMSDNAATRISRLSAEWDNLKVAIGNSVNAIDDTKAFTLSKMVADLTALFQVLQNNQVANSIQDKKGGLFAYLFPNVEQLFNIREYAQTIKDISDTTSQRGPELQKTVLGEDIIKKLIQDQNKELKKQVEVRKEVNDELEKSEEQRMARIAKLDRSRQISSVSLSDYSSIGTGISSLDPANAQLAIANAIEKANEKQREQIDIIMMQRQAWANLSATMSDVISQTIAAGEPLSKSLAKITATIINQLEQITLARMVANNAKFGLGGILAAAAGFGIVKGLFNRIARNEPVETTPSLSYSRTQMSMQNSSFRGVVRGQDIYLSSTNYQKYNRSTSFIG